MCGCCCLGPAPFSLLLCCFCDETLFFSSGLAVVALWHGPKRDISGEKGGTKAKLACTSEGQIASHKHNRCGYAAVILQMVHSVGE